jgi:hypothetical protein
VGQHHSQKIYEFLHHLTWWLHENKLHSRVHRWSGGICTSTMAGSLLHLQGGFVRRGDGRLDRIQATVGAVFRARERVRTVRIVATEIPTG